MSQLEFQLNKVSQDLKNNSFNVNSLEEKLRQKTYAENQMAQELVQAKKNLAQAEELISTKNSQLKELDKKYNNLAVAKMSSEFSQAVSDDQKNSILKKYAESQSQSEQKTDLVRSLTAENSKYQLLLLEAKHTILKLSTTYDQHCSKVLSLDSQVTTLQSKLSSDHLASSSLQSVLEDRQREYVGLRKHYQVIEDAIRGTAYV